MELTQLFFCCSQTLAGKWRCSDLFGFFMKSWPLYSSLKLHLLNALVLVPRQCFQCFFCPVLTLPRSRSSDGICDCLLLSVCVSVCVGHLSKSCNQHMCSCLCVPVCVQWPMWAVIFASQLHLISSHILIACARHDCCLHCGHLFVCAN